MKPISNGRRPSRSANGASSMEPSAIPNSEPSTAGVKATRERWKSSARPGTARAMAWMS